MTGSGSARAVQAHAASAYHSRTTRTISACSRAILLHHGIDAARVADMPASLTGDALHIGNVRATDDHVTMTITLPMPYGAARMTIRTGDEASVTLPGMTLSPAIAAAAIGRPLGRLTGHPALAAIIDLLVTGVEDAPDIGRHGGTILHFADFAEPIGRASQPRAAVLQ